MSATGSSSRPEQPQVNVNGFDDAGIDGAAAAAEVLISRKVELEQEYLRLEAENTQLNGFVDGVAVAAEELISSKVKLQQECLRLEAENARLTEENRQSRKHARRLVSHNMHMSLTMDELIGRYNALTIENAENRDLALESEALRAEVDRLTQENESQAEVVRQMMASQNYARRSPPQSTSWLDELSDKEYSTDRGAEADDEDSGDESGTDTPIESSSDSSDDSDSS